MHDFKEFFFGEAALYRGKKALRIFDILLIYLTLTIINYKLVVLKIPSPINMTSL
jgi:hypothetical protein